MRVLIVVNPRSRRGQEHADRVRTLLAGCGLELTEDENEPVEAVVAAGGDGTVIRVIPLAIERNVPLGIIPLGTFNDLAKTLGIPLGVDDACRAVSGGKVKRIDVGRVNGYYFVNEASVGFSTRVARKQTTELKRRFGWLAVVGTTIETLRESRPFHLTMKYGGKTETALTVQATVANSGHFGGVFDIPGASLEDAALDFFSIEVQSWFGVLPILGAMAARRFTDARGVRHRRGKRFELVTRRPHHISTDGEPAGFTPATFEVVPGAVQVFVP